ncbi:MAG: exonuclease domain-containing protein, partial [Bacteroidaceae bacterium]|nr:exonuclease domain-containing protein [Bacteroidaceae bacterium]
TNKRMPCQFGLVVVQHGVIVDQKKYLFKPPGNKYDDNCVRVHKITAYDTKNLPEFDYYWDEIKTILNHSVVVAHNLDFDYDVLSRACEHYNLEFIKALAFQCTMRIFRDRSLKDVCKALNIQLKHHHDSLADATACAQIFLAYLNGVNPESLIFESKKPKSITNHFFQKPTSDQVEFCNSVSDVNPEDISISSLFKNKNIVISGTFQKIDRETLRDLIADIGGISKGAITGTTDYIIVGDNFGPKKMEKVITLRDLGNDIKIINETTLYQLLDKLK